MCKRMNKLQENLAATDKKFVMMSAHSAVIRHWFGEFTKGGKPENVGTYTWSECCVRYRSVYSDRYRRIRYI